MSRLSLAADAMFEYFSADERVEGKWASSDIPIINLNKAKKWKMEPVISCTAKHFFLSLIFRPSEQVRDGNLIVLLYRGGCSPVR